MGLNVLILTVYFICVIYVLYQMALSVEDKLEDQVKVVLNAEDLTSVVSNQLQQQPYFQAKSEIESVKGGSLLKITFFQEDEPVGAIGLRVLPEGKLPLEPPIKVLNVSIANTLPDQQVYIDWDRSAISVHKGFAQRVIRQVPGMATDLLPRQAFTVVNPGFETQVTVTGESLLNRNDNQISLEVEKALVNLRAIPKMPPPVRQYTLQMLLLMQSLRYPDSPPLQLILPFTFQIEILPDHVALPVLSWLLNFNFFPWNPSQKSR